MPPPSKSAAPTPTYIIIIIIGDGQTLARPLSLSLSLSHGPSLSHRSLTSRARPRPRQCWRVQKRISACLPHPGEPGWGDPRVFEERLLGLKDTGICGLDALSPEERKLVVEHAMDPGNWAK